MDFSTKTALITGSGQGVGEGIARALASYGANVCLVGRTFSKVEAVAMDINKNGGCWSFKIPKGNILKYWTELSIYLLGENVTKKDRIINGISISPKKTFCIIKIWNNNKEKNDKKLLNTKMDIPFDSCIYKQHN